VRPLGAREARVRIWASAASMPGMVASSSRPGVMPDRPIPAHAPRNGEAPRINAPLPASLKKSLLPAAMPSPFFLPVGVHARTTGHVHLVPPVGVLDVYARLRVDPGLVHSPQTLGRDPVQQSARALPRQIRIRGRGYLIVRPGMESSRAGALPCRDGGLCPVGQYILALLGVGDIGIPAAKSNEADGSREYAGENQGC